MWRPIVLLLLLPYLASSLAIPPSTVDSAAGNSLGNDNDNHGRDFEDTDHALRAPPEDAYREHTLPLPAADDDWIEEALPGPSMPAATITSILTASHPTSVTSLVGFKSVAQPPHAGLSSGTSTGQATSVQSLHAALETSVVSIVASDSHGKRSASLLRLIGGQAEKILHAIADIFPPCPYHISSSEKVHNSITIEPQRHDSVPSRNPLPSEFVRHDQLLRASFTTAVIVLFVCITAAIFAYLRRRDPRRRVDLLARREERRNQRLYRRALRQQQFKTGFNYLRAKVTRQQRAISAEKVVDDLGEEQLAGRTMPEELFDLRNAYRFVDSIIGAEEGRRRTNRKGCIPLAPRPRGYSNADSEKSTPPPYEEIDYVAVDVLQYSTAPTEDVRDDGSASSVITTSRHASEYMSISDSEKE